MTNSAATIIVCGCASAAIGGFYLLQGLGVIPAVFDPGSDKALLADCVGAAFLLAGPAAMLTLVRGRIARPAINLMSLVIVICMGAIAGWVALDAEPGGISGPLALVSPKLNDVVGRAAFGFGALICVGMAVAILRSLLQPPPAEPADPGEPTEG